MTYKKQHTHSEEISIEKGSDNIFADIGVSNPEEELTKAALAWQIEQVIKKMEISQAEAAKLMGINQPKVSALLHRKLAGFSVERLMHFLNALGQDITIVVTPKPRNRKEACVQVREQDKNTVKSRNPKKTPVRTRTCKSYRRCQPSIAAKCH